MKLCIDCRHYDDACMHERNLAAPSPVDGIRRPKHPAAQVRAEQYSPLCGPEGAWWEARTEAPKRRGRPPKEKQTHDA